MSDLEEKASDIMNDENDETSTSRSNVNYPAPFDNPTNGEALGHVTIEDASVEVGREET